jgi:hypothetical protein
MQTYDFSLALKHLKQGESVTRLGWNNPHISVHLQTPTEKSKMTEPYLYMKKVNPNDFSDAKLFPLDLSCESLLAEDWVTSTAISIE